MKTRAIALLFNAIMLSLNMYADNIIVADKDSKRPVPSATVSVWLGNSDKPLSLVSDDNGNVRVPQNAVRLDVRKFGYEEKKISDFTKFRSDTVFLELGYVLREVAISAIKRDFYVKSDKYIYEVSSDSSLAGKSTLDALGRIPILKVTTDGDISSMQGKKLVYKVNGLSNPLVTGDLKISLRSLKADYIKRIEIKTNPVGNEPNTLEINIITKGRLEGYQADVTSRLNDYSWRTSLWGMTKINKFCVSGSYFYMWNHDHGDKSTLKEIREQSGRKNYFTKESTNSGYRAHFNNAEISMSYDIDDKTVLSAYGRVLSKSNPHSSSLSNTVIKSADLSDIASYSQQRKASFDDKEYYADLSFEKLYGENAEKGKLFVGYDFYKRPNSILTKVTYDVTQCSDSSLLPELDKFDRKEYVGLTMHTAMVELRRHFLRKHTVFASAAYRYRLDANNDSLGINTENIKLRQHLLEGNVAYKFAVDKFSLYCGFGVRSYNDELKNTKYGPEYSYSRHNLVCQPTLSMSVVRNYKRSYGLSYSMTSMIPDISVMNPFVFKEEPTRVSYGNPRITPEKTHKLALEANYNLKKLYINTSFSVGYTSDIILQYSFLDGNNVLNTTFDNIAYRWMYGLSSFMSWNVSKKTSLRANLSLDYIDYFSSRLNKGNRGCQFSGGLNLSQELPLGVLCELRGNYNTPWVNFQGKGGRNFGYGISLVRSFLSNKLRLSLSADNFVPTYYDRTYVTQGSGYIQELRKHYFHASYSFSISYTFGNLRARVKKTESSISNDDIKKDYDE